MAAIRLQGLNKSFGSVQVLHDLDLEIDEGSFVVLLGPSGCGKSTLLRIIAGLEDPTSGDVEIAGRSMIGVEPRDRGIAMVFQSYALYPHMTVRENLGFGLRMRGTQKSQIAQKIDQVSDVLAVRGFLDRYPRQLSGGQRQRVAMGRAIIRDPKVFLFDEPLSNLDAQLRLQLRVEIKRLHQELGSTAVYVTHDQVEAMTMADRVVLLRDGVVQQDGSPADVYDRPANLFVARFIGSPPMNTIEGRVVGGKPAAVTSSGGLVLPLAPEHAQLEGGRPVVYGIRPEHLVISDQAGSIRAMVVVAELVGRETILYCKAGATELCVAPGARTHYRAGDVVPLFPSLPDINVFDQVTGNRL